MDIGIYFQHVIEFGNFESKNEYQVILNSENPFLSVPFDIIKDQFKTISKENLLTLSKQYNKRIIFRQKPIDCADVAKDTLCTLQGEIRGISSPSPMVTGYSMSCPKCKRSWEKENYFIIVPPKYDDFCDSLECKYDKIRFDIKNNFVDAMQVTIQNNDKTILGYILNNPSVGYQELKEKIRYAYQINSNVNFHGIMKIFEESGKYQYGMEIWDVDILSSKHDPSILIPFVVGQLPKYEKEMVMSVFFSNIIFMQRYLEFSDYVVQKSYPDLVIYGNKGTRFIEFEYDVANFYMHKHHLQSPSCDLIIAWQNTSKRNDVPYLLMENLIGRMVPDVPTISFSGDFDQMIDCLIECAGYCFPHRNNNDLIPIVLSTMAVSGFNGIFISPKLCLFYPNGNDLDRKSWSQFCMMFNLKEPYQIPVFFGNMPSGYDENQIVKIEFTDFSEKKFNDIIGNLPIVQEYLIYIKSRSRNLFYPIFEKEAIVNAISVSKNILVANYLLIFAFIIANFKQKNKVESDEVRVAYALISKCNII